MIEEEVCGGVFQARVSNASVSENITIHCKSGSLISSSLPSFGESFVRSEGGEKG